MSIQRRRAFFPTGWRMGWLLMVCGVVGLGWFAPLASAAPAQEMELLLNTTDGKTLRLADLRGKVVLVNFWATWCPPCLEEIPALVRFQEQFADKGVVVVGVDFMDQASLEQLRRFVDEQRINYPIVYGDSARLSQLAKGLGGVFGLPVTKLLDRQGQVVSSRTGGLTEADMRRWVEPLLTTTAAAGKP
ncbi:MAG: TlpA family protein disulfide reductase [Magnetococcus sp. YQC-3]